MHTRRLAAGLLAVALACTLLPSPAAVADDGNNLLAKVGRPNGNNFPLWRDADKKHLREFYDGLSAGKGTGTLYSEWITLQRLAIGYTASNYNIDPDTGLHVFPATTTGMLLALGDAMRAREQILSTLSDQERHGQAFAPPPLDAVYPTFGRALGDSPLKADGQLQDRNLAAPYPGALINAIADMQKNGVPSVMFDNAAIVVVPFTFPNLDDGGWMVDSGPFAAWISTTRATNHPVGTLLHLAGHQVLTRQFGETPKQSPANWDWYLNLRGSNNKPQEFTPDTEVWGARSSENFTEDFRLAFGTGQLEGYPSRASFKTPKSGVNDQFRRRLTDIMTGSGTPLIFETAQVTDGNDLTAASQWGLPVNHLVTPEHLLTVSGSVTLPGGGRPIVTVYGRQSAKEAYVPIGGGQSVNALGQFSFALNLSQGSYDMFLESSIPGQTGKTRAPFRVSVISKRLAGDSFQGEEFSDLGNHWAKADIEAMLELGAVSGYPDGTFKPDNPVRRGEFFKIMITGLEGAAIIQPQFSAFDQPLYENDEYRQSWSRPYIDQAYFKQFFNSAEYFPKLDPNELISRQEMARLMGGVLDVLGGQFGNVSLMNKFGDVGEFDDWRMSPISIAVSNGVINGYPNGTFLPRSTATRAETCVMIHRLIQRLKEIDAEKGSLQFGDYTPSQPSLPNSGQRVPLPGTNADFTPSYDSYTRP